jgi:hypothetical protein
MKTFFFVGNKRSGTTYLIKLLNWHPQIFVSHESDVIWILYNFFNGKPFSTYPLDTPKGMDYTLKKCSHILNKGKSVADNFFNIQDFLMREGSLWLPPMAKKELTWVGDKKPFQCADPKLTKFILDNFSEARFIHLVRHPFTHAQSAKIFGGELWKGMTLEEIVERWTVHEKHVLELKHNPKAKILDVKYEDLCKQTVKELKRILRFLDLNNDPTLLKKASLITRYKVKAVPQISCTDETKSIMGKYGYRTDDLPKGKTRIIAINLYWTLKKSLERSSGMFTAIGFLISNLLRIVLKAISKNNLNK